MQTGITAESPLKYGGAAVLSIGSAVAIDNVDNPL